MKDKRNILKIACLLEVIYVLVMTVYYLFFIKEKEEMIAGIFMLIIGVVVTSILYKESKKEIGGILSNCIDNLQFYYLIKLVIIILYKYSYWSENKMRRGVM